MPAKLVRRKEETSMARDGLDLLSATLRSFPNVWKAAAKIGGRFGSDGCSEDSRRPGRVSAAPQAGRDLPAGCWMTGKCFWAVEMVFWRPW